MNKKIATLILLLCPVLWCSQSLGQASSTPEQILNKTASTVTNNKGVTAEFTVTGNGQTGKGKLFSSGNKFMISMPDVEIWYNGKDMYTYNKRIGETTVVKPTAEELAESNPLLYIDGWARKYKASFSNSKVTGEYVVDLIPVSKNAELKKLTVNVKRNDFTPAKLVATGVNGTVVSFTVNSFKTGTVQPSVFEYPKSKYPKVEIVDLR